MSQVRACRLLGFSRSSLNYRPQRPDDTAVRERLRELAMERVIFGAPGWICTILGRMVGGCVAGLRLRRTV
jgi:hypothetical protein